MRWGRVAGQGKMFVGWRWGASEEADGSRDEVGSRDTDLTAEIADWGFESRDAEGAGVERALLRVDDADGGGFVAIWAGFGGAGGGFEVVEGGMCFCGGGGGGGGVLDDVGSADGALVTF